MIKKAFKLAVIIIAIILLAFVTKISINKIKDKQEDIVYSSEYIYVLEREDSSEKYEKNSKDKAYPASLTKVMTAIVALEHIEDLSQTAEVDVKTYQDMVAANASMAGFYGREPVTYRDLVYGTILPSGGEAANSLAINISGSVDKFVDLMNEKARELELKNTHFTNPEGLHDKRQYTTAYDMAKLLDYALKNGDFRAVFTKKHFTTTSTLDHPGGIVLRSTVLGALEGINMESFSILGGKSGTTNEAGQCWITLGTKDDREYIVVVMGAHIKDIENSNKEHIKETIEIYKNLK